MRTAVVFLFVRLAAAQSLPVPFEQDGHWGYKLGRKVVIEPRFVMAERFSHEGIAAVVDEQGWAYIGRSGQLVIRPLAVDNGPDYFQEGLARFTADGKTGFFDRRGKVTIPARYAFAEPFSQGRAAVCEGCREVAEGEHRVLQGGRWGFIDRAGTLVIPVHFEEAGRFERGTARVKLGGGWKYIDRKGVLVRGAPVRLKSPH
jgi:hypothetical protein